MCRNNVSLKTKDTYVQSDWTYSYISLFWCEISFTVSRGWRLERTTCWNRLLLAEEKKQTQKRWQRKTNNSRGIHRFLSNVSFRSRQLFPLQNLPQQQLTRSYPFFSDVIIFANTRDHTNLATNALVRLQAFRSAPAFTPCANVYPI